MGGGFHDALLHSYSVDLTAGVARFLMEVCVGNPASPDYASREARRFGTLILSGLGHISVDLPDFSYERRAPYLIDLCAPDNTGSDSRAIDTGKFSGRFFSSSTNSFIHFSAASADFTYEEKS